MIYMFGSVGLIIVNSVVLIVELIQKAGITTLYNATINDATEPE